MTLPAPKHYWNFDEISGTTAADSVGGAVIALDRANWVPGKQGNAIRFNPNDGVKLATTSLSEIPPPWTAGFWVKREADSDGASLFSSNSYALKLEQWGSGHKVGFTRFSTASRLGADDSFNYVAPLSTWVHVALVGTATEVTLYVDGNKQGSVQGAIDLGLNWLGSTKGYVEFASAILDEIQVFDVALTDEQVGELANGPSSVSPPPPPPPAGLTTFPLPGKWATADRAHTMTISPTQYGNKVMIHWDNFEVSMASGEIINPNAVMLLINGTGTVFNGAITLATSPERLNLVFTSKPGVMTVWYRIG
jgi:hypothetical protein